MRKLNLIVVFNKDLSKGLFCIRAKEPYKGKYNFVGGKIENDNGLEEAYRELYEETNISKNDIKLVYFMNLSYIKWNIELEVYYGVLNGDVNLIEEVNKLEWRSLSDNFFNLNKYAGEGNIGHIIEEIKIDLEREKNHKSINN